MTPPPRISIPDWADQYRRKAKSSGSTSGRWRTSDVEVARGPMLAATEPGVTVITVMTCTQLLKTSLLENVFGYHAHLDPCPMLLTQPKDEAAEQFAKERIIPLIRATPVLRDMIRIGRRRGKAKRTEQEEADADAEPENTLTFLGFVGGFLALAGAGSPDNLARRPIRRALCDEIDKYPVTREGDPLTLIDERLGTFTDGMSIRACSPTVEDESRIADSYAQSDQRRASLVCPHCDHRFFPDFFRHVDWNKVKNEAGENIAHHTATAQIYCDNCGTGWSEADRLRALPTIRWHQTRPFACCSADHSPLDAYDRLCRLKDKHADPVGAVWDWWASDRYAVYRAKCPDCGKWGVDNEHAGFQAGKLYSPWPKDRPSRIAKKWIDAQGDEEKLQSWWNTQLGLPHRPRIGRDLKPDALLERREVWAARVPDGVALITAGLDVQPDRIEAERVGWGRGEESWSLEKVVFEGDPDQDEVWQRVDAWLMQPLYRADGRAFTTASACIDSGGHNTQAVYSFCRARRLRRVWAIKGDSERNGNRSPVWPVFRRTRRQSKDYKPVIIGTNAAKDRISACLQIEAPGPGCMHFPADRDAGYFAQLAASNRLVVKKGSGRSYRVWEKKRGHADEALDCRVYAYAALWGLIVTHKFDLDREADKIGAAKETPVVRAGTSEAKRIEANKSASPAPEGAEAKPANTVTRKRKVGRSNYLNRIGR